MDSKNELISLKNIKSEYFIHKLFDHLKKVKSLLIANYNKNL